MAQVNFRRHTAASLHRRRPLTVPRATTGSATAIAPILGSMFKVVKNHDILTRGKNKGNSHMSAYYIPTPQLESQSCLCMLVVWKCLLLDTIAHSTIFIVAVTHIPVCQEKNMVILQSLL